MSILGADEVDYLRALYFMLDDAAGMANESMLPAPHFDRVMRDLMVSGLVYRTPCGGTLVWQLTNLGVAIVKRELELEDREAKAVEAGS